jgi:CheY-like chemotaxis protein
MCATKILAVDDEVDFELLIAQRLRRQIREREFDFRFARHGQEALAAEPDIDLMLLDINMPVMDGLTLLAELRLRQSPVRAIIVSAYGDMANIRTAMNRALFQAELGPMLRGAAAMGIADKFHPLLIEQLEAVHRRSAVAEMRNKTDLADARGIAHILRTGRFRHVHVELSAAPPAHLTTQPQTQVPRSGERSSALDQDVRAEATTAGHRRDNEFDKDGVVYEKDGVKVTAPSVHTIGRSTEELTTVTHTGGCAHGNVRKWHEPAARCGAKVGAAFWGTAGRACGRVLVPN